MYETNSSPELKTQGFSSPKIYKFVACADLHIRSVNPRYRKDKDYLETCCGKLRQIVTFANKNSASILIAGDIFDTVKTGYRVTNRIMEILQLAKYTIYVVPGQHDMAYHSSDLSSSPLYTLAQAEVIDILSGPLENDIYGCGWGSEVIDTPNNMNILLMHYCVTPLKPPFFLSEALSAVHMLDKYKKFKYIVTGDYHISHFLEELQENGDKRMLINCGSMMRENVDQFSHNPCVYLIDLEDNSVMQHFLSVAPVEEVFDLDKLEIDKSIAINTADKIDVTALVDKLQKGGTEVKVTTVLQQVIKQVNPSERVINLIGTIMAKAQEEYKNV